MSAYHPNNPVQPGSSCTLRTPVRSRCWSLPLAWLTALLTCTSLGAQQPNATSSYYRDLQPIFVKNCITCHGPGKQESNYRIDLAASLLKGGDSEKRAITPGNLDASHLIERITSSDPATRMPPKGTGLDPRDIAKIKQWISSGATIAKPAGPKNPLSDHWAFQPIQHPHPPAAQKDGTTWGKNEIDQFISQRLGHAGLQPSPPADRTTLIRRLYLVMLGLPPTPQQVDAFLEDKRPDAYQRLIENVLNSQHYGERWAQHWLDCVRYAETTGYEVNGENGKIYPYRDYVIRSLNEDKPYNRFLVEQLAGDQFKADAATGFLVVGPHDRNQSPDPLLTAMQFQDGLDEIIKSTSAVMMGVTLGCARCHDHKYDPFSQRDYYAMQAVFAGTRYSNRRQRGPENDAMQVAAAKLKPQVDAARKELHVLQQASGLKKPIDFREYEERLEPVTTTAVQIRVQSTNVGGSVELDDVEVWTVASEGQPSINIAHRDQGATATSSPTAKGNQGKTAELLLDGTRQLFLYFKSVDKTDVWIKIFFQRPVEIDRLVIKPRGNNVPVDYRIDIATGADQWKQVIDSRDRFINVQDQRAPAKVILTGIDRETTDKIVKANARLRELQGRYNKLKAGPQIFAGNFVEPENTHLMVRGNPLSPGPEIAPAIPSILGKQPIDPTTKEAARRLILAEAIASPQNPLTARVIVNRVWQHSFGVGIVDTPSDFGINGSYPTHPELLDWLASYLIDQNWSLKSLHRKLLMSSTFRQASWTREDAMKVDADCRLLWRFPSRRLAAEALRDSILTASGKLNRKMYGPSFSFFEKAPNAFEKKTPLAKFDEEGWRRMIYGRKIRLEHVGVFGVFDCPDASQMTPTRSRSTTAVQALSLLNSQFVNRQAEYLANDIRNRTKTLPEQVNLAVFRTLCRPAEPAELKILSEVASNQGLTQVCRILMNLNEFVFIQ